jgi:hypothetical protein
VTDRGVREDVGGGKAATDGTGGVVREPCVDAVCVEGGVDAREEYGVSGGGKAVEADATGLGGCSSGGHCGGNV